MQKSDLTYETPVARVSLHPAHDFNRGWHVKNLIMNHFNGLFSASCLKTVKTVRMLSLLFPRLKPWAGRKINPLTV